MTDWHIYDIQWNVQHAQFLVDGTTVLQCEHSPKGPLGFVAWFDNQYAIVTPWGKFGYGRLSKPGRQWMELDWLKIQPQVYQTDNADEN